MKVAIAGVPKSGKTTKAKELASEEKIPVMSTDSLIDLEWSEASLAASYWFDEQGDFIIEGMMVPRALRKWFRNNKEGKPVDKVIWLGASHVNLTKPQYGMGRGAHTVLVEIAPLLHNRGVVVEW